MSKRRPHAQVLFVWGRATGVGGTERRMVELATELRSRGLRVHSFLTQRPGATPLQELLLDSCTSVQASPFPLALARTWRAVQPDLVLALGLHASLATRAVKRTMPSHSVVIMAKNGLGYTQSRLLAWLDRLTQREVDLYLANSHAAAAQAVSLGIEPKRVRVLPSALGAEWFVKPVPSPDARSGVLMVGNSRPEKNQRLGLQAFALARLDTTLTIYTDDASELRREWAQIAQAPAVGRVKFIEGHHVTPRDYDGAAILLHTSVSESLPRAILEARARGCYVLASDCGDTRLAVVDGGEVLDTYDPQVWAATLQRKYTGFVTSSREAVPAVDKHSVDEYATALLDLCQLGSTNEP